MFRTRDIDKTIILATMALVAIGFVMVYSTSYIMAMQRYGSEYFFVKKHLIFIALGFLLFFAAARIPYHLYHRLTYLIFFSSLFLLIMLIFIPEIGSTAGGAKRWLKAGPLTFQPSEPAKLAVIIYLSYYLAAKKDKVKSFAVGFLPPIIMSGLFISLILNEPDFGTALSLGIVVIIMMFIGGVRWGFIFSLIGEELGLIGVSVLIILYLAILISGIRVSLKAKDLFGQYLAVGITLLVVLQAAVNMAVVTALLPTKGLTLPFVSYGGTSLIVNMLGMGILLSIYRMELAPGRG